MTFLPKMFDRSRAASLRPYGFRLRPGALPRALIIAGILFFCFIYGGATALFVPYLIVPLALPLVVLALLAIWALPDLQTGPARTLETLFFASYVSLILWPNYLAIALPGLPWITVGRLIGVMFTIVLLVCSSVSSRFRSAISKAMGSAPWISIPFCVFLLIQVVSIVFSANKSQSIDRLITAEMSWTGAFLAACYLFSQPGRSQRFVVLLCMMGAVGLAPMVFWEHKLNHVPWAGHVPSFLKVNDPIVDRIMSGTARHGNVQFRAQGTFSTSLGLSEYIALTMPFVLYYILSAQRWLHRALAAVARVALVQIALFTQARTGMVGIMIAFLASPLSWAALRFRRTRGDLFSASAVYLSPVLFAIGLALTFVVPGLKARIWHSGGDQYSNQSRIDQWHMGIPKIASHPWGYGISMGGETLGYTNPAGGLSIDSYPLRLALEYGVVGAVLYFVMIIAAVAYAARTAWNAAGKDREVDLLAPVAITLTSFMVMKTVFAQEDNQSIMFALVAMVAALHSRARAYATAPSAAVRRGAVLAPVDAPTSA